MSDFLSPKNNCQFRQRSNVNRIGPDVVVRSVRLTIRRNSLFRKLLSSQIIYRTDDAAIDLKSETYTFRPLCAI